MNLRRNLIFLAGILISVGLIAYFTREVDWRDFARDMRAFRPLWLIPAAIAFYVSMYMRAVRWGLLFRPHYDIKGWQAFPPIMVGFAFNSILPGRVGELVRCVHIGRSSRTGFSTAVGTVVAERLLDALTLFAMLAVAFMVLPDIDPATSVDLMGYTASAAKLNAAIRGLVIFCIVLVAGVIVFMFPRTQLTLIRLIRRARFLPPRVRGVGPHMLARFAEGLHALSRPRVMALVLFHSIGLWVLIGLSNLAVARGFDLPMNVPQSLALVTLIGIFILIPAAPGYWGLFEAGTIFSLQVMGITSDLSTALAYAITIHLLQFLPIVVIGLAFAWRSRISLSTPPPR